MIKNLSVSKAQPGPINFSHQPGVVLSCIKYMYIQVTYIVQFCITVYVNAGYIIKFNIHE